MDEDVLRELRDMYLEMTRHIGVLNLLVTAVEARG